MCYIVNDIYGVQTDIVYESRAAYSATTKASDEKCVGHRVLRRIVGSDGQLWCWQNNIAECVGISITGRCSSVSVSRPFAEWYTGECKTITITLRVHSTRRSIHWLTDGTRTSSFSGDPLTCQNIGYKLTQFFRFDKFFFWFRQAMLRLERHIPYKEKMERVDEVISELSLSKCQNTIIGVPGRMKGLSGGERKRLAFASEALTDPTLLMCDEPTSGLDSFMAHNVLQVLKRLAQKGKTIILTIHQPSSEIFGLFDKLLLMAEGRVAFLGTPTEANRFFAQLNAPCPNNYNPADFYVELLAIVPGNEGDSRVKVRKICDAFAVSDLSTKLTETINGMQQCSDDYSFGSANGNGVERYRASWFTQFRAILWRSWSTVLKEPLLVRVRLMQTVVSVMGNVIINHRIYYISY